MATRCSIDQVRILFALAGLHRVDRGAEVALISIASALARQGHKVTMIGSGPHRAACPYRYIQAPALHRTRFESFTKLPPLRSETAWEEASFAPGLLARYRPNDYDITATCAFPFTHWALRRPVLGGTRPRHVFITQNGDWPAYSNNSEFRFFSCDGLVCTNPDYLNRNADRYRCTLIPNGVDLQAFSSSRRDRRRFGLPEAGPIVLMVSALIPSKNVAEGIAAVARIPSASLVVAGDGPLRADLAKLAEELLPGRYCQITVPATDMPALYRSSDVFMHLSTDESFGNVFVEAMASGLPVVAYDSQRTRWIIGDSGFFPDSRSAQGLAAAVSRALDGAASAATTNADRAHRFSWSRIGQQYAEFFEQLLVIRKGAAPAEAGRDPHEDRDDRRGVRRA